MATQNLLHHTRYNQYDSMVRPIIKYLTDRGVQYVGKTRVTDIDIGNDNDSEITVCGITMVQDGKQKKIAGQAGGHCHSYAGLDGSKCLLWFE
jgi:myosin-crossreactive antigen